MRSMRERYDTVDEVQVLLSVKQGVEGYTHWGLSSVPTKMPNTSASYSSTCDGVVDEETSTGCFLAIHVKLIDLAGRSGMSDPLGQTVGLVLYIEFKPYQSSSMQHRLLRDPTSVDDCSFES